MMKEILVYADWIELPNMMQMGILRTQVSKGEEIFSFEDSKKWLESGYAQDIDPDLKLFTGPQYLNDEKPNFGIFLDSSPDRWGRMLMKRREAIKEREVGEKPKNLYESDFLVGVNDETRMGGIRFKLHEEGDFLEHGETVKAPPITSIRELEQASLRIEDDDFYKDDNAKKWLNLMMAPGSSLGGARPKASVRHTDGSLWIAKFPSKNDDKDSGIWEFLVNRIAKTVNINVAEASAAIFSQKQHTYLTKRFDRSIEDKRLHFASAMTLLGYKDGYSHKEGGSYLEIVDLIETYGASPKVDLIELWRRIVFSVGVSNTDDHLRNHGFILTRKGWNLSPAYDINPNESGAGLSLNISENDNSLDYDLCLSIAEYFRWEQKDAKSYVKKVRKEISYWSKIANELKISNGEQNFMEKAFNI
jgi:serine/threonine-protein kinase HipA